VSIPLLQNFTPKQALIIQTKGEGSKGGSEQAPKSRSYDKSSVLQIKRPMTIEAKKHLVKEKITNTS
jgi:hypothetical protein